jgi:sarcosine oxidase
MNREPDPEDERLLRAFAERYFPDAAGPTLMLKTCLFTNSPDEHFILDRHPDHPGVAIAAGFSGHGYKFCSVVGEIMADLAERGETKHDIEFLGLKRFANAESVRRH